MRKKSVIASKLESNAFRSSLQSVRDRLLQRLAEVKIFRELSKEQRTALLDRMSNASFSAGDSVFEQGDVGDSFYVILSGECDVLRDDFPGEDIPETCLAKLGTYDFFGERALLREEPRYATVFVTSDMACMSLTKTCLETALGMPLAEVMSGHA